MSLTDAQVAEIAGLTAISSLGVRARELAREVQSSRKLIADLRAMHADEDGFWHGGYCQQDGSEMPCPTIRLIDAAELSS